MRYGFRRPSFRKSFSARTSGRLTRSYKRALNPYYGRKGMGLIHPRRAMYNRMYYRTTKPVYDNESSGVSFMLWVFAILFGLIILAFV